MPLEALTERCDQSMAELLAGESALSILVGTSQKRALDENWDNGFRPLRLHPSRRSLRDLVNYSGRQNGRRKISCEPLQVPASVFTVREMLLDK